MHENNSWDYAIQRAMSHPENRKIIVCLHNENLSFTDLLNRAGAEGNHGKFGYHLRTLREFVELEPITKKYRLTDRGRLLAEAILDFRSVSSREKAACRYAERLRIGDHAVFFYDNMDYEHQIVFPFLNAGLSRGEATVYVVSEDKMDSELRQIQKYGIDIDSQPKKTFTMISACEWYLRKGRANAKTIIANWETFIHEKKKSGFAGVQAACETAAFINNGKTEELLRYSEALGRKLTFDLCGLCLYDKTILEQRYMVRVFNCHGHIISKDLLGKTIA